MSRRRKGFRRRLRALAAWERECQPGATVVQQAILLLCDEWLIMADSARANVLGWYKEHLQPRVS